MFGWLRARPFADPELGSLARTRGRWRGTIAIAGKPIPLALAGGRNGPDAAALPIARTLPEVWSRNRDAIARALLDHLAPYREAIAAGECDPPPRPLPASDRLEDVWRSVDVASAAVVPLAGVLVAEVAIAAAWDEEHTLGARFEGAVFRELNGSILPP